MSAADIGRIVKQQEGDVRSFSYQRARAQPALIETVATMEKLAKAFEMTVADLLTPYRED